MHQFSGERADKLRLWRWCWPYLAIALVALVAGIHLLQKTWWTSGDGLHHLHRVAALSRYLLQGVLYPRWVGEFAFGYGVPVFNFYSPFSYYFAQLFAPLGADWALKLTMLAGLFVSGVFLYLFARPHAGSLSALVAAAIYVTVPYRLVDLYPRAALAEHLAFLWLPLILWAYDGLWTGQRRVWQVIGWAGLVLTHSFSALMFAPFFVLYVLWSAWRRRQGRPLLQALVSLLLAVGLTAFFWLPLMWEAQYAGLGSRDDSRGYRNHLVQPADLIGPLLYDYTTGEGRTDTYFAFGAMPTLILVLSVAGTACVARRTAAHRATKQDVDLSSQFDSRSEVVFLPTYGIVICLSALFVASRPSQPLWDVGAVILAPIQFPWRFLVIASLGVALASTGLSEGIKRFLRLRFLRLRREPDLALVVGGVLVASLLITGLTRLPFEPVVIEPQDMLPESLWDLDRETGQAGTTWAGEFLPVSVREQRWALGRAPEAPRDGSAMPPVAVKMLRRQGDGMVLDVESAQPWTFRLHAFYFPGWQVRVDGAAVPTAASGDMGLVAAEIPAGARRVAVAFDLTAIRHVGKALTTLTLVAFLLAVSWPLHEMRRRVATIGLSAFMLLALYVVPPTLPQTVVITPVQALFGDQAQLVGVEVGGEARPGQLLPVELYWLALRENGRNDKSFVHLVDAAGQVVAQHDGDPGGGFTPTSRWQPGEFLRDRHYLELPMTLPPGRYRLKAGLYRFESVQNLLTHPATPDGRVDVGEVVVR